MARKKLPYDFLSWVNLYDFLKARDPRAEKFTFKMLDQVTLERTEYSITMTTVAKYAWEEIQEYRMVKDPSIIAQHYIKNNSDNFHREYTDAACRLLDVLTIEE